MELGGSGGDDDELAVAWRVRVVFSRRTHARVRKALTAAAAAAGFHFDE
jgi:hypothetical protein